MTDALPEHPGTIEFVDGATGEVTRTEAAADVPEEIRFAPGGEILRSTYQRAE